MNLTLRVRRNTLSPWHYVTNVDIFMPRQTYEPLCPPFMMLGWVGLGWVGLVAPMHRNPTPSSLIVHTLLLHTSFTSVSK
jgi:hypothetical protein